MAEVLGVVASGIAVSQIAGQVTKSIFKLKEYWDQVQEAPDEIKYLLHEIDSLNLILNHIQTDQAMQTGYSIPVDNICIRQSFKSCKEGANELRGLADELAEKVDCKKGWRKKVGSIKVVLKREDIKRLKRRMKYAIQLLQLSYQWHTNAMIQLQPEIIVTRMTNHIASLPVASIGPEDQGTAPVEKKEVQDGGSVVQRQYDMWISSPSWITYLFGQFEYHQRTRKCKDREIIDVIARYKLPEILTNKVLDLQCHQMLSGWRVNIQAFRVIPFDNSFFDAIENNNLFAVKHMLANREYFVSDRDEDNKSPLHFAVQNGNVEICKALLSAGADVSIRDCDFDTPFHTALIYGATNTFSDSTDAFEICRLLLKKGAMDILINDRNIFQYYNGPLEMLQFLHQEASPSYARQTSLSVRNRVARAAWIAKSSSRHNTALLVEYWLKAEGGTNGELSCWVDEKGKSFLHILAESFARASCGIIIEEVFDESLDREILSQLLTTWNKRCTWRPLIRKAILAGCSVMAIDNDGRSILWTLILEFLTERYFADAPLKDLKAVVREWLEDLNNCGVDLLEYGKAETAHWKTGKWGFECLCEGTQKTNKVPERSCQKQHASYWHFPIDSSRFVRFRTYRRGVTVMFSYGRRPEDWILAVYTPGRAKAGGYWNMVDGDRDDMSYLYELPQYEHAEWIADMMPEDHISEDDFSESGGDEFDQEAAVQSVPGSWSQNF